MIVDICPPRTVAEPVTLTDTDQTCEHVGCTSGEPTSPGPLTPGGPVRPASWGGAGAGLARRGGPPCPAGLDYCCGLCGCWGE